MADQLGAIEQVVGGFFKTFHDLLFDLSLRMNIRNANFYHEKDIYTAQNNYLYLLMFIEGEEIKIQLYKD